MARILLFDAVPPAWFDALAQFLRAHQPEGLPLELAQRADADPAKDQELLAGAHVLLVGLLGPHAAVGEDALRGADELRLVQKLGSRAAGIDLAAARALGIPVSLIPAPAHVACAEHALLLILALAKKLIPAHQRVVRRPLREAGPAPRPASASAYAYNWAAIQGIALVAGKTIGLVGIGDIAIELARRARALGMTLLYCDKNPLPKDEERELGLARRELDDLLRQADFVSLHVALTPDTANLLNADRLALMKPTAFLINTARGGLVDEAALANALRDARLAGAALDAWAVEPTPRDNPLLKLDGVIATPHIAAGTLSRNALFEAVLPNILAALRGEPVAGSLTPDLAPRPAVPIEPSQPKQEPPAPATPPAEQQPPKATEDRGQTTA